MAYLCDECRHSTHGTWMGDPILYCQKMNNSFNLSWGPEDPPKKCEHFEKPPIISKTVTWDGLTPTIHIKEIKKED